LRWFLLGFLSLCLCAAVVVLVGLYSFYAQISRSLPDTQALKHYEPSLVSTVYAADGTVIGEFGEERRFLTPLEEMPPHLIRAFLAAEDERFYEHGGVDVSAIFRALLKNVQAGEIVQGASTITQQVVKSLLLTPERSWMRKVREAILAHRIDQTLTKDEILFLYLNHIYLGSGAYGVEAAARTYFDKSVGDLHIAESALLAGLPKAPSRSSPHQNLALAKGRQHYVLQRMAEVGAISPEQAREYYEQPLNIVEQKRWRMGDLGHFTEEVRRQVEARYGREGLYQGGLHIHTTLDMKAQEIAEKALKEGLQQLEKRHRGYPGSDAGVEGAFMAMEPHTGRVLCLVGGRDFASSQFNRATQALRQPGSAFKPVIYAAALDKGFTEISILMDTPLMIYDHSLRGRWRPANYDRKFWGPTPLRKALIHSRNVVTVKLLDSVGVDYTVDYARNLGITSPLTRTLSLALGASAVTLRELMTAYTPFVNQGMRVEPYVIEKVLDRHGNLLEKHDAQPIPAISPQTAYIMTDLLRGVVEEGTGRRARALGRPAAGKTGTTNDLRDAWFVGYTPRLLAGVWVGHDDHNVSLGRGETGGRAACPIWLNFMKQMLEGRPVKGFTIPEGIVLARINPDTGALASADEPGAVYAPFAGEVPAPKTVMPMEDLDHYLGQGGSTPSESFFKSDLF